MRRSAAPSQHASITKRPCFAVPYSKQSDATAKNQTPGGFAVNVVGTGVGPNGIADVSRSAQDILHLITKQSSCSELSSNSRLENIDCTNAALTCTASASTSVMDSNANCSSADVNTRSFSSSVNSTNNSAVDANSQQQKGSVGSTNILPQRFKVRPQLFEAITINQTDRQLTDGDSSGHQSTQQQKSPAEGGEDLGNCLNNEQPAKYFSVMWCKVSKKKHKKWEGDAILITRERSVTLVDLEGKEIGRSTGYKKSELDTLTDGQMLVIGGKEIEVMGVLSEEQFKSGTCFQSTAVVSLTEKTSFTSKTVPSAVRSKAFVRPYKSGGAACSSSLQFKAKLPDNTATRSHFDPNAPNALVMPRPDDSHQWQHNSTGLPVVDVVVDPHLTVYLRPHQRDGIIFLYQCVLGMRSHPGMGAILADEMGLGKTLQCIALIWTLYKQGPYGGRPILKRILVITPGSLVKNWCKEFRKWLSSERLNVYAVTTDNKLDDFLKSTLYPVLIISYEMFMRNVDAVRKVNFDLLVCDEGHRLKNANIKTASCITSLPISRRIVLTGTPIQNELQELFAIADFCNPGILGSVSSFRRIYEEPIVSSRQPCASLDERNLGLSRAAELNRITETFILRRTQELNNQYLPPRVDVVLFCRLTHLQLALYRSLIKSRAVMSCLHSNDSAQHLRCISALKKLCNHPQLLHSVVMEAASSETSNSEADLYQGLACLYPPNYGHSSLTEHSGKMKVLEHLLTTFSKLDEKVVVISNYTSTLDLIEALCKSHRFLLLRLDGQTPTNRRLGLVERFNSRTSPEFIFLLSTKAGGVGLNLIGASRLILYDIDWNPANDLQAMARVWRDGQRRCCYVYRLLSTGTIEEKIYQRQVTKQDLSGAVVDTVHHSASAAAAAVGGGGGGSRLPTFDAEQLRELFQYDETTLCSTHDLLECSCLQTSSSNSVSDDDVKKTSTSSEPRQCQILLHNKSVKKNTGMDDLRDWCHIAGPGPDLASVDRALAPSSVLSAAVTFAMWARTNASEVNDSITNSRRHASAAAAGFVVPNNISAKPLSELNQSLFNSS